MCFRQVIPAELLRIKDIVDYYIHHSSSPCRLVTRCSASVLEIVYGTTIRTRVTQGCPHARKAATSELLVFVRVAIVGPYY